MAQREVIEMVDDLDGTVSDDVQTVAFSLDGVSYEIDLTPSNREQLFVALEAFTEAARRTGGRRKYRRRGTSDGASLASV
jgi:hypothetical protein